MLIQKQYNKFILVEIQIEEDNDNVFIVEEAKETDLDCSKEL